MKTVTDTHEQIRIIREMAGDHGHTQLSYAQAGAGMMRTCLENAVSEGSISESTADALVNGGNIYVVGGIDATDPKIRAILAAGGVLAVIGAGTLIYCVGKAIKNVLDKPVEEVKDESHDK